MSASPASSVARRDEGLKWWHWAQDLSSPWVVAGFRELILACCLTSTVVPSLPVPQAVPNKQTHLSQVVLYTEMPGREYGPLPSSSPLPLFPNSSSGLRGCHCGGESLESGDLLQKGH